ncbi:DUF4292 domain-containing protein [Carboxylicivirga taeanensis]|uniref:DUF4292 domain-containing protein n=1 Tax=Carboxylicivirga taeanensis TaxID=1416875 RepID=UPI003F6DACF2
MLRFNYLLIILVFGLVGCKTTREFYDSKEQLKNIPDAKLISSVEENYFEYESVFYKRFKAEVNFNSDTKSFKGNLYVLRDSSIVVSINPLMGIELMRVRLSKGKVEIIDRTKKTYSHGNYEFLWKKFLIELDYQTLQSIIANQLFVYPIDEAEKNLKRYKHYCTEDVYQLQSVKEGKYVRKYKKEKAENMIFHQFSVLPEIFKINEVYIRDFSMNSEIRVSYDNFISHSNVLIPTLFTIEGARGNDKFSISINFEHVDVNGSNAIGFKVSEKYKKIDLNDVR